MPSRYYVIDEGYEPKNELERKILDELKKHPGEHSSRTLAVRLGINDILDFQKLLDTLSTLREKGVIGSAGWLRMKEYVSKVVENPNTSITLDEIIKGTELAIKHAEETGRDPSGAKSELKYLKQLKKT